jgi:thiamine-phosphate pyrophosphorylase
LLCLKAGANSAAVVSDIVRADNPEARAKEWIAATRA